MSRLIFKRKYTIIILKRWVKVKYINDVTNNKVLKNQCDYSTRNNRSK